MSGSVLVRVLFDQVTCMAAPTLEYPVDGADPRRASSGSQCTPTWQPVATRSIMLAGALRKDDFWEVAVDLWAFVHGHLALYRGGRFAYSEPEFRAFFRRSLNRFLRGLKK